jgi:hypothetical protein
MVKARTQPCLDQFEARAGRKGARGPFGGVATPCLGARWHDGRADHGDATTAPGIPDSQDDANHWGKPWGPWTPGSAGRQFRRVAGTGDREKPPCEAAVVVMWFPFHDEVIAAAVQAVAYSGVPECGGLGLYPLGSRNPAAHWAAGAGSATNRNHARYDGTRFPVVSVDCGRPVSARAQHPKSTMQEHRSRPPRNSPVCTSFHAFRSPIVHSLAVIVMSGVPRIVAEVESSPTQAWSEAEVRRYGLLSANLCFTQAVHGFHAYFSLHSFGKKNAYPRTGLKS